MDRFLGWAIFILYLLTAGMLAGGIFWAPAQAPTRWFDEKQTISTYSAALLYTCCIISAINYLAARSFLSKDHSLARLRRFWGMAIVGFFALMLDEYFVIHEGLDKLVTSDLLGLQPPPFLEKLDALIIVAYGLAGLAFLFYYRHELKLIRGFFAFLVIGSVFAIISLGLDLREDTIGKIYLEESAKGLANTSFVLGWLAAAVQSYRAVRGQTISARQQFSQATRPLSLKPRRPAPAWRLAK